MATRTSLDDRGLTASDVLAPQRWASPLSRAGLGLDVACTKIAIDLQSLSGPGAVETIRRRGDCGTFSDRFFRHIADTEPGEQLHAHRRLGDGFYHPRKFGAAL